MKKNFTCKFYGVVSWFFFISIIATAPAKAQFRNYSIVYSDNAKGNIAMFGNTVMAIVDNNAVNTTKMNDNSTDGNSAYGNDNENMEYVDMDGTTGNGSVTRNSSTADLILPAGTNTIKLARLYWGSRVKNGDFDLTQPANRKIKIRKGTSATYSDATAIQIDSYIPVTNHTIYQAYADITELVQNYGAGTYQVGNIPASTGKIAGGGYYGGWCIVVVYENASLNYNSLRLYDGFQLVSDQNNPQNIVTLTGLNVPSGALISSDAKMGVLAWEGDAGLTGDYLKINGNLFSNGINASANAWNGTVSDNGSHISTKSLNFTNQMGLDIDQFNTGTGYGISPNDSTVTLEFGTAGDWYTPGILSFVIRMKDPEIIVDKFVTDANNNKIAEAGELLTYTVRGRNAGIGNANKVILNDTLPASVTYVPNSLKVVSSPGITPGFKTDASGDDIAEYIVNGSIKTIVVRIGTGANTSEGGIIAYNETFEIEFKVTVNNPSAGNSIPSIINVTRVKAKSDANETFVDDGVIIMNPLVDIWVLGFNLNYLKGYLMQSNMAKIAWGSSEIDLNYFEIERSNDGNNFTKIGKVTSLNNASGSDYSFIDKNVPAGTNYYRLKTVDKNGDHKYSNIVLLNVPVKGFYVRSIYPNPFIDKIGLDIVTEKDETVQLKLVDNTGKAIRKQILNAKKGSNTIYFNDLKNLNSGLYSVEVYRGNSGLTLRLYKGQ